MSEAKSKIPFGSDQLPRTGDGFAAGVLTVGPLAFAMSLVMHHFWPPPPAVDDPRLAVFGLRPAFGFDRSAIPLLWGVMRQICRITPQTCWTSKQATVSLALARTAPPTSARARGTADALKKKEPGIDLALDTARMLCTAAGELRAAAYDRR
jgi:hypothetical protein